ncbi:MAG: MBG-2 domain-containing protein, partial [Acidobacteria bacterium]|nr:MBG-2 domain-containing protein [Acidobacteriota bacterium]
ATLTVTADDASRLFGVANPTFTATFAGFRNEEALAGSGVTGAPSLTTTATETSAVGEYPITAAIGTLAAANYDFTFVDGTLTVEKRTTSVGVTFEPSPVDEGATTQVTFTVTDGSGSAIADVRPSGAIALTQIVRFTSTGGPLLPNTAPCVLTPSEPGASSCTVTVRAVDNPDATIAISFAGDATHTASAGGGTLVVNNVAPTITTLTAPLAPLALGLTATVAVDFTDPGSLDTHTCTFTWDDGQTTTVTVSETGNGSCSAPRTYTAPGVYTVGVEVTDKDGGKVSRNHEFIVIYDPTGGFVTGGGWIMSPINAYLYDLSLTGRASFGFVSKYQRGANVPTGQTEFQFRAGNLNFHSSVYEWLVVSGAKAQHKGSGTINGSGDYGFILTATDGQQNGGGGFDKFRIKIWDKATGVVVYDNKRGQSDDIDQTDPQVISGGSIVIHNQ